MSRPVLAPQQLERFRQRLCAAALRRFSAGGYEGVTLRGLARELGCSYATPYRYFRDKLEIFAAVRALAFERFAAALEAGAEGETEPERRLRALGAAYLRFAREEPQAYRIMFQLDQRADAYPEYAAKELRSWEILREAVARAVESGVFCGDPTSIAHVMWAGVHGLASLHLAGKLVLGRDADALSSAMLDALFAAHRPAADGRTRRRP